MTPTWRAWPSIENSYYKKNLSWWLERHPGLIEAEYVITEKLHGTNVQIHVETDGEVAYGTRNQFVDGAALFGWPGNANEVVDDLDGIITKLRDTSVLAGQDTTVYGELYGPGIQKGVNYGDLKRVAFFGLKIGKELQPFACLGDTIHHVPVVAQVSGLQDTLDFDTEFPTMLHSIEDNICEGIVMQPCTPVSDNYGDSYFLLKKKNEAFEEKKQAKKIYVPDEVVDPLTLAFRDYITEQRMNNVFSKEGPIDDMKDIGRYIRLILTDAIEDFSKDHPEIESLDKKQRMSIFNVGSAIAKMLLASLG